MVRLLDINVLIALCDADHAFRPAAKAWFLQIAAGGWATCPLTENGVLRIMGQSSYPQSPGSPAAVRLLLAALIQRSDHRFWPDDVSLMDAVAFPQLATAAARDLTDLYLLGLAVHHQGCVCTFDTRVDPAAVTRGVGALELVPVK
jgi:hypothetical protein